MRVNQIPRTRGDLFAIDAAVNAGSHRLAHVARHGERQAAIQRRLHDRTGQHVVRRLLKSGAELQHPVRLFAGCRLNRKQARAADGQRAGFVEQNSVCMRQGLERCAAFDQNAAPRSLSDAGDECDRCRQNERTRRRRDKHGETANQIA